ncbi:hypothetical protein [Wolbachia endosymbiont of Oedothorax gibbosus]|uniref:hypothetical protein n=1 Tax=Wolbachia endosymbiont of Oedothorax gibbosus TaxID=931100 RepID=UPI0020246A4C|nr:hypothetical protein [Wolbachia endosymbiont of Oedothorax gibbosus]
MSSNSSEESEQDWSDEDTHQLDNKKGTSTPESGYRSDDDQQYPKTAAPPSHQPNTKKPPLSPKPKNKPEAPPASQVNNVDPVNSEVKDPSTLSVKERAKMFGNWT